MRSKCNVDMASVEFASKAETLQQLSGMIQCGHVLPQVCFSVARWRRQGMAVLNCSSRPEWLDGELIVRSSAYNEDRINQSLAGHYLSIANVQGEKALSKAIAEVIDAYDDDDGSHQVFIQPMLSDVRISGVAFTRNPNNGGHYYVINYAEGNATDAVTSGRVSGVSVHYHFKFAEVNMLSGWKARLLDLLTELEGLFGMDRLDVEFAVDHNDELFVFQVRPLTMPDGELPGGQQCQETLAQIQNKFVRHTKSHPYLYGRRSVFGIMPDWNPAEIIGVRPRPLALSLYKQLVTDSIWAYQRNNYGYKNLRSFPLLIDFSGLPYIDARVSFNSFIPADIDASIAERLVNYYIECLVSTPAHHDKVEFEIVFSCYSLDLPERLALLKKHGFSDKELELLSDSLRRLTNRIINNETGLWKKDLEKLAKLGKRQQIIAESELCTEEKIYWLIEDCKRYGTLPFAGLARAAFIAVQLLKSLVSVKALNDADYELFMSSLETISSQMEQDRHTLQRDAFLAKYGHLRPGAYDINSQRYDEAADEYFPHEEQQRAAQTTDKTQEFKLTLDKLNAIQELLNCHGLDHDVLTLFNFIREAIKGREYAKFVFSKSLSDALVLMEQLALENGFSRDDASYADIDAVLRLYGHSEVSKLQLQQTIAQGKANYRMTQVLTLPPLLTGLQDIYSFAMPCDHPNFITQGRVKGLVALYNKETDFNNAIVCIENADPGYDWIFSRSIAGFITMYGGVNSHMAIRAAELGVPAVIGAGQVLFEKWSKAVMLSIDCANQQVQVLQ